MKYQIEEKNNRQQTVVKKKRLKKGCGNHVEGDDLVVHFNVHFDPRWLRVQTSDLFSVLSNEIILEEPMYLANLTIDPNSIDVKESSAALTTQQPLSSTTAVTSSPPTTVQPVPRRCGPVQLEYCNKLLYNTTSYPNKLGHKNLQEVMDNVIAFRHVWVGVGKGRRVCPGNISRGGR
uniref:Uncharacterized protein n=1 Tax=Timema shepardi TaxID=629360 RepID=A0A7R9BB77_TIMSH|nr:unnamed protein product [Timema shepardi]